MNYQEYLDEKTSPINTYSKLNKMTFKNWSACKGFVEGDPPEPTPETKLSKDSPPFVPTPGKCTRKQQTEEEEVDEAVDKSKMDSGFVVKLIDYLETTFPSYGKLDSNIKSELKNIMPVGTEEKMKEINRVKKKVNDVIAKEKKRFLDRVSGKVEDIKIKPDQVVEQEPETKEEETNEL